MKKIICLFCIALGSIQLAFCQYESPATSPKSELATSKLASAYLGGGISMNGKYGIGIAGTIRVSKFTLAELTCGRSLWGNGAKIGASLIFNAEDRNSWCPSIGFGRATGSSGLALETDVKVLYNGVEKTATTHVVYNPLNLLFFSFQRQILSAKGNRFVMEFGYSIPIGQISYELTDLTTKIDGNQVLTSNLVLTDAQKQSFNLSNPSGLMISFSYHFAFKQRN